MDVAAFFSLRAMPFAAGAAQPPISTPGVADALEKLDHILAGGATAVLLAGEPGTGKSFILAQLAARLRGAGARAWMPADLRSINPTLFDLWDYLLIDEADRISGDQLRALAVAAAARGKRLIAAVSGGARPLPPPVPLVRVRGLAPEEAVDFLRAHLERAGAAEFPFDGTAARRLADASAGSARALKSLAGAALVEAMVDDAHAVTPRHAERAVAQTVRSLASPAALYADAPVAALPMQDTAAAAAAAAVPAPVTESRPAGKVRRRHLWLVVPVIAGVAALAVVAERQNAAAPPAPAAPTAAAILPADPPAARADAGNAALPATPTDAAFAVDAAALPATAAGVSPTASPAVSPAAAGARPRVVIRYDESASALGVEAAYALAGMLERGGWRVGAVRPAADVGRARTRYFDAADRAAAEALAAAVAEPGSRLERAERGGAAGTVEVWLAAG